MQYFEMRDGTRISRMGYGCMRFSKSSPGKSDIEKTEREILEAINSGINYFDTAYVYGDSEKVLGEILERNNVRDKVNIATKMPYYMAKNTKAFERIFNTQLERLRTDHIDFYLIHMLINVEAWDKMARQGFIDWLDEKMASGQIRHMGFSFHGDSATLKEILDHYDWDFCMVQYNYYDETTQASREGVEYASGKGIPVIVMEPLRGGKLVNDLPHEATEMISAHESGRSAVEWSFRWLFDQPTVSCVLSGMNDIEQVQENVGIESRSPNGCMSEDDFEFVHKLKDSIRGTLLVGCTACGYCMPCPHGVDIPRAFEYYNKIPIEGLWPTRIGYQGVAGLKGSPSGASLCAKCGACERHCPQHIEIREELDKAARALEPGFVRFGTSVINKFMM